MYYKINLPLFTICLLLVVSIYSEILNAKTVIFDSTLLRINGEAYFLEIAKTQDQRQLGLMFRPNLGSKNGMVFVYPDSMRHRIWMKNTKIPLTVLWIDEVGEVLEIQRLEPCRQDPCESYGVNRPSKYIIELNDQLHHIKAGDKIIGLDQI